MSRLFVTAKEAAFFNDIGKEYIKDILGQGIIYYPVSMIKTQVHDVYDEAIEKVFENPIKIDCIVGQPEREKVINQFGLEFKTTVEVFIQARDLIDKQIEIHTGDYFVYGREIFEIMSVVTLENIYGQPEYEVAFKLNGNLVRTGQIDLPIFKQLLFDAKKFSESNVQKTFEQQRGFAEDSEGNPTGDYRQVQDRLEGEMAPIALGQGPREVKPIEEEDSSNSEKETSTNSFYNE